MKPAAFEYHSPTSRAEALSLLAELGDDCRVLAGGQSLMPMLSMRLAVFPHLVDLGRVGDLSGISGPDGNGAAGTVAIGAMTPQAAVESNPEAALVPLLGRATELIGHFQIRNRGTVGGSLAHADPAAEYPAVALTLDATVDAESARGRRSIPASEFFTGHWSTALEPEELLVGVRWPVWSGRCGFAVEEFARRHGDFAIAGAMVALELGDSDDRVRRVAIGLFGLGSTPLRARSAEGALGGSPATGVDPVELGRTAVGDVEEIPVDSQGDDRYRRRVGAAMVARAWSRALEEATSDN